ncbi:MAG: hypothetical protein IJ684_01500 [Bacteroidales bacterium]|nr:hypothetical protein [Bacteroidales bacterium]
MCVLNRQPLRNEPSALSPLLRICLPVVRSAASCDAGRHDASPATPLPVGSAPAVGGGRPRSPTSFGSPPEAPRGASRHSLPGAHRRNGRQQESVKWT